MNALILPGPALAVLWIAALGIWTAQCDRDLCWLFVVLGAIALAAFSAWMGRRALQREHEQERADWAIARGYLAASLKEANYQRDVLSETALAYYRQLPKRGVDGRYAER